MRSHARRRRLTLTLGLGLLVVGLAGPTAIGAETRAFIVQADDPAAARAAVERVGARVTHELGIIRAVGAELTAAQRHALAGMAGVRVHANRTAGVDSAGCDVESGTRLLEGKKLTWQIGNFGSDPVTLAGIHLGWPSANGELKEYRVVLPKKAEVRARLCHFPRMKLVPRLEVRIKEN